MAHTPDIAEPDATPSDVPDVLAPGLRIVFVGINPGRVSSAAGAHFANPRNDFWRLIHAALLTSRLYEPSEQFSLLEEGIGVTNAAYRTTPGSGDLRRADFAGSAERIHDSRGLRFGYFGRTSDEYSEGASHAARCCNFCEEVEAPTPGQSTSQHNANSSGCVTVNPRLEVV